MRKEFLKAYLPLSLAYPGGAAFHFQLHETLGGSCKLHKMSEGGSNNVAKFIPLVSTSFVTTTTTTTLVMVSQPDIS